MELRHLRYFLAVVDELHFGHAAARLHIAQPPLSQAIRKLETELGVELLHRTSRVVAPTNAGRVFAKEARKVLAAVNIAVAEARRAGGVDAPIRIGCMPYFPIEQLLTFLEALSERGPELAHRMTHLLSLEQVTRLRNGELDVGIFPYAEDPPDLDVEPLFAGEPLAAFLALEHPLASKDVLGPDDLRGEELVFFPHAAHPALNDRVLALIKCAGYSFAGMREAGGGDDRDLLLAAASGPGVAFAPHSFKEVSEAGAIVLRRALNPAVSMPDTVIAWRANPPRELKAKLNVVRDVARKLRLASEDIAATVDDRRPQAALSSGPQGRSGAA